MLVPKGHPFLIKAGPKGEEHEPLLAQELNKNLKADTVFYDVGARFGYHTLLLRELGIPESQIHAFEGDKLAFWVLQQNHTETDNLTNAFVSDGKSDLSLDEYLSENPHPDIIKIDVEGAEGEVLRGLEENLHENIKIYVEIHTGRMEEFGDEPWDLVQLLDKSGFDIHVADHRQNTEKFVPVSHQGSLPSGNYLLKAV
ncbi:FkbM family methyltransferase [Halorubrum distributum]|uniref:FkbM family methyltransferase n=1 Tax=Halorubrum distributum TaxID=29283 RepID=UPI001EF9EC60|nr:FkbM family methyltransferase [Halorubrum distributum]